MPHDDPAANLPVPTGGDPTNDTRHSTTERALAASEARFRAVQEGSPDGFMLFRSVRDEGGRIVDFAWIYANPAAERMVGRPAAELAGRHLLVEMPGNRAEGLFDAYVCVVETGEPWQREFGYRHEGLDHAFRSVAVRVDDGFGVTFTDVTARQRAEAALRRARAEAEAHAEDARQLAAELETQTVELRAANEQLQEQATELEIQAEDLRLTTDGLARETAAAEAAAARALLLQEATSALVVAHTADEIARDILAVGVRRLGARHGTLALRTPDGPALAIVDAVGLPDATRRAFTQLPVDAPVPFADAARTRRPVYVESLAALDAAYPALHATVRDLGVRALAALPLVGAETASAPAERGATLGAVVLDFAEDRAFAPEDRALLEAFARQCAGALERAALLAAERAALRATEAANAELAAANAQLQEQTVELEAQAEELHATTDELVQRTAELERSAAALAESERQFRTLADGIPTLAWTAQADGHIDWYNRRWYEYTGTTPEEMAGWGWQSVHDPAVLPAVLDRWRASIATGQTFEMTFPLRGAAGRFRSFLTRVTPVTDAGGRVARWFGTNTDVTALHETEAALRTLNAELEARTAELQDSAAELEMQTEELQATTETLAERSAEAERARVQAEAANAAKSDFLAAMSHELRTPLNAIQGYADLLALGIRGEVTPGQQEDLARIKRSGQHLLTVINDILQYAKLEAGQLAFAITDVPLDAALAELATLIGPQLCARALVYEYDACDPALAARADRDKLQQIVLNLLTNAVKFTLPGGRVTLRCTTTADTVAIRVRDTGIGIPADRLEHIFDPFVQVERRLSSPREGVGLGLAISRDLAHGMGGDLTVASTPAVGSVFTLVLPRADVAAARAR